MADLATERFNFDTGSNGATITTTAGGLDGGTSDTLWTYSTDHAVSGTLSAKNVATAGAQSYRIIDASTITETLMHFCAYVYVPNLPTTPAWGAYLILVVAQPSTSATTGRIAIGNDLQLRMQNGTTSVGYIQWGTLNLWDQWVRLEWKLDRANSSQTLRAFYGSNLNGTVPDQEVTGALDAQAGTTRFRVGNNVIMSVTPTTYWDAIGYRQADWVGPYVAPDSTITKSGADSTVVTGTEGGPRPIAIALGKSSAGDSTQVTSTEHGVVSASNPTFSWTDNFTRANGWLGSTSIYWVPEFTGNPIIATNQLTATGQGTAVYTGSYSGVQTVELTLVSNASTNTVMRCAVLAGVENLPADVSQTAAWGTSGPYYRFGTRGSSYALQVKGDGAATWTDLMTYSITPAPNHRMKMTYDPYTGAVNCYIDSGSGYVLQTAPTGLSPIPGEHTRVGLHLAADNIVDTFVASWSTSDPVPVGWKFYKWDGSNLILLNPKYYNGTTEAALDMTAASVYTGSGSTLPQVSPIHSDLVLETVGVNTAFNRDTTLYGGAGTAKRTAAMNLLTNLGVRYYRDRVFPTDPANNKLDYAVTLAASGIKMTANVRQTADIETANGALYTQTELDNIFNWIVANPSAVVSIQGLNEPNDIVSTSWATWTTNHQKQIYDEFNTRGLNAYKHSGAYGTYMYVLGPALKDVEAAVHSIIAGQAYTELANLNIYRYMHKGNWHRYPLQQVWPDPSGSATYPEHVETREQWASDAYGGKPLEWTEYGFQNPSSGFSSTNIPDDVAAAYHIRILLDSVIVGRDRVYQFDLLSPTSIDTVPWGLVDSTGPTASYTNWAPKQAYTYIKNLLALMRDDTGTTAYTPAKFGLELSYTDSNVDYVNNGGLRWAVFEKRNKQRYLVMWRLVKLWDRSTSSKAAMTAMNVTIKTDGPSVSTSTVAVKGLPISVPIDALGNIGTATALTPTW